MGSSLSQARQHSMKSSMGRTDWKTARRKVTQHPLSPQIATGDKFEGYNRCERDNTAGNTVANTSCLVLMHPPSVKAVFEIEGIGRNAQESCWGKYRIRMWADEASETRRSKSGGSPRPSPSVVGEALSIESPSPNEKSSHGGGVG